MEVDGTTCTGNVNEEGGDMNSCNTQPSLPIYTQNGNTASVTLGNPVVIEDQNGNKSAVMENITIGSDNKSCSVETDSVQVGDNRNTIESENDISQPLKIDTPTGGVKANGVEILTVAANESDHMTNIDTQTDPVENMKTSLENTETSGTEKENSQKSTVNPLNVDHSVNDGNTSTEKTADIEKVSEYRDLDSSDSESDSSSSSSSSSSSDEEEDEEVLSTNRPNSAAEKSSNKIPFEDLKTEGELGLDSLPPIEELSLDIEEGLEMVPVGTVSSVLGVLAIIQSSVGVPPLNEDTILFTEGPKVFGRVFEVFGPVSTPWYSVRFNTNADIETKGIKSGMKVFYAPAKDDYTKYVFVSYLKSLRGSDASWKDDNEPPEKYMEYSDDEEERASKSKSRAKDRSKLKDDTDGNEGEVLPGAKIRRASGRGTGRPQKHWNDTEQYGTTDNPQSWNNAGDLYNGEGPRCSYGNQPGRGGGPRYPCQPYNRGGATREGGASPQRFHRLRAPGPFGRPPVFQSEPSYNMNSGPGQFYPDSNRVISPGRFNSPGGMQIGQSPNVGHTSFRPNFTTGANQWSNMESYNRLPRQPVTDHRLMMNQDSRNFSSPPQTSYNPSTGLDINPAQFPPPQSTQHMSFQSPPPALNTNTNPFIMPPPILPSSNKGSYNPAVPPPPLHPLTMPNQQMARPMYPQHPPVFGGQPYFNQGPSGRQ